MMLKLALSVYQTHFLFCHCLDVLPISSMYSERCFSMCYCCKDPSDSSIFDERVCTLRESWGEMELGGKRWGGVQGVGVEGLGLWGGT